MARPSPLEALGAHIKEWLSDLDDDEFADLVDETRGPADDDEDGEQRSARRSDARFAKGLFGDGQR